MPAKDRYYSDPPEKLSSTGHVEPERSVAVQEIALPMRPEGRFVGAPTGRDLRKRRLRDDLLADPRRAGDDVEGQGIEDVFVRRLLPFEALRIESVHRAEHGDADEHARKDVAIGDVDLKSRAERAGVLL